jgi:phosphoglycerate dehydrogenase-like enzyme
MAFAEAQLTAALSALPIALTIAHSLDEALQHLPDCDMVVAPDCSHEQAAQFRPALAASPVRWLQFLSAGRERLTGAGLPARIKILGPGNALAPAVAEHALALALACYRGIPHAARHHGWDHEFKPQLRAMEGDTALIVGLGAIGRDVARRAKAFGMRVIAATRTPCPNEFCERVEPLDALNDLLPQAGVVFLALAFTPETRHLFGQTQFAAMRRGAFFINVARGGLVDQPALAAALDRGHLGGAGLDVADPEPLPDDDPLWRAQNLVITPHVAAIGSWRSEERLAATVLRNILAIEGNGADVGDAATGA